MGKKKVWGGPAEAEAEEEEETGGKQRVVASEEKSAPDTAHSTAWPAVVVVVVVLGLGLKGGSRRKYGPERKLHQEPDSALVRQDRNNHTEMGKEKRVWREKTLTEKKAKERKLKQMELVLVLAAWGRAWGAEEAVDGRRR